MPRLFLLLSLLMLLAACQDNTSTPDAEPPEEIIPFRIDGALEFLREGELLLTITSKSPRPIRPRCAG